MRPVARLSAALALAALCAASRLPAAAQHAPRFTPAKLLHRGATSTSVAGSGRVVVQVQVNADGTHKATRVLRSTNRGDNAAALAIAQSSTYAPAHRGSKPITSFYDFTLAFHGSSIAGAGGPDLAAEGGAVGQIDRMIRAGHYADAQAKARQALVSEPGNATLNAQLGTTQFFLKAPAAAAASFDKARTVPKEYADVAARAYQLAAQQIAASSPALAVEYGQKAVAMAPGPDSSFALGYAELSAGQSAAALVDLQKAHDQAFAPGSKMDMQSRVNIDSQLMQAYLKSGRTAEADAVAAEIQRLDPGSSVAQTVLANHDVVVGNAAMQAGKYGDALNAYLQAAQAGPPQVQVTADAGAAFATNAMLQHQGPAPTASDYARVKSYADKALLINPGDAQALFAAGIALYGEYVTGLSTDRRLKQQSVEMLGKAKSAAQAAGNSSLASSIAAFIQKNIK